MAGIEFEREVSFEVSDKVAEVLNSIRESRVKNYMLTYCGNELAAANAAAQRCNIKNTVETIELVGNVLAGAMDEGFLQAVKSHLHTEEDIGKIFEDLDSAFTADMTKILTSQCGCKGV